MRIKRSEFGDRGWTLWTGNSGYGIQDDDPRLDDKKHDRKFELRRCDQAAMVLYEFLGDHNPEAFSPLAKNRDEAIDQLKHYMQLHRDGFRYFGSWLEEDGRFLPTLPSLDQPATDSDVTAGRAVFALENPGPRPDLDLPLASSWLGKEPDGHVFSFDPHYIPSRDIVILQVERDRDGTLIFGVSDGIGIHIVPSREIGSLHQP